MSLVWPSQEMIPRQNWHGIKDIFYCVAADGEASAALASKLSAATYLHVKLHLKELLKSAASAD